MFTDQTFSITWLESPRKFSDDEETFVHSRVLVVKTNDYGRYNPTPKLSKPHFKLIPN